MNSVNTSATSIPSSEARTAEKCWHVLGKDADYLQQRARYSIISYLMLWRMDVDYATGLQPPEATLYKNIIGHIIVTHIRMSRFRLVKSRITLISSSKSDGALINRLGRLFTSSGKSPGVIAPCLDIGCYSAKRRSRANSISWHDSR